MNTLKLELYNKAVSRYGIISPAGCREWEECYTVFNGKLQLWFNDKDDSTHLIEMKMDN